ncbi:MAG: ABC transporter permease subunit [Verrucomicrobia bacterium]|nr:ABC transporter permease subunit [Verrucomicrobiota bacterium]MBU4289616.1 ABC transporter permease subunit [Verrucomicrobiota bacterium]MBU4428155.1 ABC transporter permease subunit [Verrucomicrobiota bacterium]MCG2680210.1 ABC transporter permease subunit [Kiritimatiellia bacterium]
MSRLLTIAGVVWLEVLRRKDVYVLFILLAAFLIILLTLDVFGLGGLVGYVKEIGLLLAWLFSLILAVAVSVRQLPQEEERGTIFPLLAKPVTRGNVILGKWLGVWSIISLATIMFYLLLVWIVLWRGGGFGVAILGQAIVLHLGLLGIITALGILFSTRLNGDAAATLTLVVTLAAYLVLPRVPHLIMNEQGVRRTCLLALYYALPHLELFDLRRRLVHNWDPVSAVTWIQIVLYGVILMAMFLLLAWMAYRGKRFSRGVLV